jgi:hypothetical protein
VQWDSLFIWVWIVVFHYEFPPTSVPISDTRLSDRSGRLPKGYHGQLEGIPYRFEGEDVIALTEDGPATYGSWGDFWTAAVRRQIRRAL